MNIIFAGTPDFAACHLRGLIDSGEHRIVAVYSQPDRPAGRGKQPRASAVKTLALEHNIAVYQPPNLKDREAQKILAALNADIMVVVAYGLLLPQAVLDTPRLGCINVHASILPRWRGAAPIQRAVEAGDSESGVTIMQMDSGLDTGDMLAISRCPVAEDETSASLYQKLTLLGIPCLIDTLRQLEQGTAQATVQDSAQSCYANKISKSEGHINWHQSANDIDRKIRAFNPAPTAYTEHHGKRLKIWMSRALPLDAPGTAAGTVLDSPDDQLLIACGQGALAITEAQLPGKKRAAMADILRGHKALFSPGTVLASAETESST